MEIEVMTTRKIEVKTIRCELPVRYDDDDMPYDFPHRKGDMWTVSIDIDTGVIKDWPEGVEHYLQMKVTDAGSYYLLDESGKEVSAVEEDYVPDCIPGEYGDYVVFDIQGDGKIANWNASPQSVVESFFNE